MRLVWTSKARSDLVRLYEFLAPVAAGRVARTLSGAAYGLLAHPRKGERMFAHNPREVRRLVVGDYELQYELRDDAIYLVRIWHGRERC